MILFFVFSKTPLEGITLHNPNIQCVSGFAASTVADLGFDPTDGASHTASVMECLVAEKDKGQDQKQKHELAGVPN